MKLQLSYLAEAQQRKLKMENRIIKNILNQFSPQYSILFVSSEGSQEIQPELINVDIVGEKAFGLSCIPQAWTLPFIVVSDDLMSQFCNCNTSSDKEILIKEWCSKIVDTAVLAQINSDDKVIVRSSGCTEGLNERGIFYSSTGTLNDLAKPLNKCLKNLLTDETLKKEKIPLIIQKYAVPISKKGHLSNERRCYEEKRDWLGQYEDTADHFTINLRNWREKIDVDQKLNLPLACNLSAHVSEVLKFPATWAYNKKIRLHFEWVWDGGVIYLVQADLEHQNNGEDPTKITQKTNNQISKFTPKCLKEITTEHAKKFCKISNVFTYKKLCLPTTKLFILDDQLIIEDLASNKFPSNLLDDLRELVKYSLVIRMDLDTEALDKRQLLPRTHEVRKLSSTLKWLKEKSHEIKITGIQEDLVFIFHNFIPATSSAFAYASPQERKVQIEALWGLPEGLYYNAHDKYIVDTKSPRIKFTSDDHMKIYEVIEKRNFKNFFVAPDENGEWTTKQLKSPFDWQGSIQNKDWAKEIAYQSKRIAEIENRPISIMWFIDVPKIFCESPIFPWYHEEYNIKFNNKAFNHRTKTPFDKTIEIKNSVNVDQLREEAQKTHSMVRRILIQPNEDKLLRDKNTLKIIGEIAKKIGAIILLEGGVLSHAYYQLMQTKAIVEVKHPFGDFDDVQEFNKLVRDKIPINISNGGEEVVKTRLSGEYLLRALREKLVEEAFEVMDAIDQDSIIEELADVIEVVDGILFQLDVSYEELKMRQIQKRNRAGGFKDGFVLIETKNPLPTTKGNNSNSLFKDFKRHFVNDKTSVHPLEVIEQSQKIEKWSDRREHPPAKETLLNLVVPIVRNNWTENTTEAKIKTSSGDAVRVKAKINGQRQGAKLKISLSIFTPQKQLTLFKDD